MFYKNQLSTTHILVVILLSTTTTFYPSSCDSNSQPESKQQQDTSNSDIVYKSTKDKNLAIKDRRGPNWQRNNAIIDFDLEGSPSSEELEAQLRPKRGGYYFYGHPHSPNFFDRYFDRDRGGHGRRDREISFF